MSQRSFRSNTENKAHHPQKLYSGKTAAALVAALTMAAGYAKAEVIDIKQAAFDYMQKEYARLKQFDTNNDGKLDENEQRKMNTVKTNLPSKPSAEELAAKRKRLAFISESNDLRAKYVYGVLDGWLAEQNMRLVNYRLNNLPKNFSPDPNFLQNSGLYAKVIKKGFFSDTDTGKYKLLDEWSFRDKIKIIIRNPKLKEIYANNFAYYLSGIDDPHGWDFKGNADYINRLLLPNP